MLIHSTVRLAACLLLCFGVAALGAWFTTAEIPAWYATLVKPSWTPPNWAFPVVWNILYLLMAVALFLLWDRSPGMPSRHLAMAAFLLQLALNAAWSPVFFNLHKVGAALAILVVLIAAVAATIALAARANRLAALLLAPYLAWISYAATLNAGILVLNP